MFNKKRKTRKPSKETNNTIIEVTELVNEIKLLDHNLRMNNLNTILSECEQVVSLVNQDWKNIIYFPTQIYSLIPEILNLLKEYKKLKSYNEPKFKEKKLIYDRLFEIEILLKETNEKSSLNIDK